MKKHLSPWREMRSERDADLRVARAQFAVALPAILPLGMMSICVVISLFFESDSPGAAFAAPGKLLLVLGILILYMAASWLIGRRRPIGGTLAIVLFLTTIGSAVIARHFLSFNALYSVVGIWFVMQAAGEIGLSRATLFATGNTKHTPPIKDANA